MTRSQDNVHRLGAALLCALLGAARVQGCEDLDDSLKNKGPDGEIHEYSCDHEALQHPHLCEMPWITLGEKISGFPNPTMLKNICPVSCGICIPGIMGGDHSLMEGAHRAQAEHEERKALGKAKAKWRGVYVLFQGKVWLLAALLLLINMYILNTLAKLEKDRMNPSDCATQINTVKQYELGIQAVIALLIVFDGSWFTLVLLLPVLVYDAQRIVMSTNQLDATEIYNTYKEELLRYQIKMLLYVILFCVTLYSMMASIKGYIVPLMHSMFNFN